MEDNDDVIKYFHKIPDRLVFAFSSSLATEFLPLLNKYRLAINEQITGYTFEFAETVAQKMIGVYNYASLPDIKRHAILSTLYAAVKLNRWAAMGLFDKMLTGVKEEQEAYAIAAGLREDVDCYMRLYDRSPKKDLHPAIQVVWELCEKKERERREKLSTLADLFS
ncbi:hypothetical protein [Paenibacillus mendelii]|uniref:Uncharacterized protein n=1 Tax=Paenibacillus mendelii TaxID=206163 RepID=A0ABV6JEW7_9BACL|nr:hypothetical protein [Paenibacillus mendelii]MCQ6557280.1 hypothetical protein [Paenibacillus mendelii]